LLHRGMPHRETTHMHFIDDGVLPWPLWRPLAAPGKGWIDHPAFGHIARAVPAIEREIGILAHHVAEQRGMPDQTACQSLGIGIDQQLVMIEAMTGSRIIRSVDAIAIQLSGAYIRQIAVPD